MISPSQVGEGRMSGSRAKLDGFAYGARLAMVVVIMVLGLSNLGNLGVLVDGAEALYVFGDSYVDTGNVPVNVVPYGSSWPGRPAGRWSDGRVMTDYFADLFGLPSPIPYVEFMKSFNSSAKSQGLNFARGGAGVTYAYGVTELEAQVDDMEALVENGTLTQHHLKKSVAVIHIGTNDYDARNLLQRAPFQESAYGVRELETFVQSVVNGIVVAMVRLHSFGIRNMVILNLPVLVCLPLATAEPSLAFKACSTNTTLLNETSLHNSLLEEQVRLLNRQLPGLHAIIADETKAFEQLFFHGSDYGFMNPLMPCCYERNSSTLYNFNCGSVDAEGKPLYTVCHDPSKAVLFDVIHPTQAASKVMVNLFASVPGYTMEGPKLNSWIIKYNV